MNKVFILEQAIKEISNTFDLKEKLDIENDCIDFELGDKEYLMSFTRTKDRENNQMIELEIDDKDKNLFSKTFYIEQTFNDIIKCLELELA